MRVTYTDRAKPWAEGHGILEQATKVLEEVVGTSSDLISAEWDRADDRQGQAVFTLRLSDWSGAVTGVFDPEELKSPSHLLIRLHRLWGDLLQIRSHKQLQELQRTEGG
jgi:hypothetical protein